MRRRIILSILFLSMNTVIFANEEDYYFLDRDGNNTVLARGGRCTHFHSTLELDKKTGEIKYSLLCRTDTSSNDTKGFKENIEILAKTDGTVTIVSSGGQPEDEE